MIYRALCLLIILMPSNLLAREMLYLSSGDALDVKIIDKKTGKLNDFQKVKLRGMRAFTFSRNKKFLYIKASVDGDRKKSTIATYSIAADGKLTFIINVPISGSTTELKTDHGDHYLAGADYQKGTAWIWQLENGIYKGKLIQEIILEQKAHATRFSPDNKVLFVPATGPNKIFQLAFNQQTGRVKMKASALGPESGAAQPRHLVFHNNLNVAYSTQERNKPGVATWKWDRIKGDLDLIQTLTSSNDTSERFTNADLHISPDQQFLYISSRDLQNELDQIIAYKINPENGTLKQVDNFFCEHFPRSFGLNKSGDYLYVAGQKANKLGVYKIDKLNGRLSKVTQYKTDNNPVWVETLALPD